MTIQKLKAMAEHAATMASPNLLIIRAEGVVFRVWNKEHEMMRSEITSWNTVSFFSERGLIERMDWLELGLFKDIAAAGPILLSKEKGSNHD